MIAPDSAAELRAERRFDLVTALLIGAIAVLAAILSVIQMDASHAGTRADVEAARLATDLSTRISVSQQAADSALTSQQTALMLGIQATAREISGHENNDSASTALGMAEESAYEKLRDILTATANTTGGSPVDSYTAGLLSYTAGLLKADTRQLLAELAEQNRQVDLSNAAGEHEQRAVLGLSFLALSGVLTGLAAVFREGRSGRISLSSACAMAAAAVVLAILAVV
jgi:hypothetical protein